MRAYPGEEAWLSGGIPITHKIDWKPMRINPHIMVASLKHLLTDRNVPQVASLFTKDRSWIRARYPNSDPEIHQWGEDSPNRNNCSISGGLVLEWERPPKGTPPAFEYYDFVRNPPPGVPVKNDSTMEEYNLYASGTGGVCMDLWGRGADSFWCSNASAGGWSEVDQECAVTGQPCWNEV